MIFAVFDVLGLLIACRRKQVYKLMFCTLIAVNANAHGRKTRPGMSDFLSACACSGVTSYDNDVSSPAAACDVTSCNAGSVPVTENYSYIIYRPLLLNELLLS